MTMMMIIIIIKGVMALVILRTDNNPLNKHIILYFSQRQWGTQWPGEPGEQGQVILFPCCFPNFLKLVSELFSNLF